MSKSRIICGDCLEVLPKLPAAAMIFADPPDNIGCKYEGFRDKWPTYGTYIDWLGNVVYAACDTTDIFWLSFNMKWLFPLYASLPGYPPGCEDIELRQFVWRYTFGQHRNSDCGSGYRPILRFRQPRAKLYPDDIRVPSARQTVYQDKRANPAGRVPDDVWEFARVCGTFKERKAWHPCQHPKDLLRRMVLLSTKPGDLVIDLFAGTGNMLEVCRELDRDCIGIEISEYYCTRIAADLGIEAEKLQSHRRQNHGRKLYRKNGRQARALPAAL